MNDVNETLPLYLQIKHHIKKQLLEKTYAVGDILPTELEYQKQFAVSRITVRHAINELVHEGYLTRTRGKGTVVLFKKLNENISTTRSFSEEMADLGLEVHTWDVSVSVVNAETFIAQELGVKLDEYVLKIHRVRGTKEYPIVVSDSFFALSRNLPIDKELYYGSMYETIKDHCAIVWKTSLFRHSDRFESIKADTYLADKLKIKPSAPILKRYSKTKDLKGEIYEFSLCYYRGDKYSCTISFGNK